jgi:hypothetical protein
VGCTGRLATARLCMGVVAVNGLRDRELFRWVLRQWMHVRVP